MILPNIRHIGTRKAKRKSNRQIRFVDKSENVLVVRDVDAKLFDTMAKAASTKIFALQFDDRTFWLAPTVHGKKRRWLLAVEVDPESQAFQDLQNATKAS